MGKQMVIALDIGGGGILRYQGRSVSLIWIGCEVEF